MDLLQLLRKGKVSFDRMLPPATRAVLGPQMATPSIVSSAKGLPSFPAAFGNLSGKVAGRVALPLAIYETAKSVGWDQQGNFNPKIIRELGALKTSIENLSVGKPSSAGRTQAQQQTSSRPVGTQAVLGGKPVYWGGDDYGWQQLNQSGSSATLNSLNSPSAQGRFIQDQGYSPAAERAYQQEASRVAQLTAQDPELQRYEFARQKAVAAGPGSTAEQSAEDLGMKIWQEKYGGTKMAQPGGAVGSFNPLMQATFGYQTGMAPGQVAQMQQTAAPIPVAPGEVPYYQGDLGTRATLETGYDPAAYGLTPGKIEDMKARLFKQAAVNSASSVTK